MGSEWEKVIERGNGRQGKEGERGKEAKGGRAIVEKKGERRGMEREEEQSEGGREGGDRSHQGFTTFVQLGPHKSRDAPKGTWTRHAEVCVLHQGGEGTGGRRMEETGREIGGRRKGREGYER